MKVMRGKGDAGIMMGVAIVLPQEFCFWCADFAAPKRQSSMFAMNGVLGVTMLPGWAKVDMRPVGIAVREQRKSFN
jgi:hypothetical protein